MTDEQTTDRYVEALKMMAGVKDGLGGEPEEYWYRDLAAAALDGKDIERFRFYADGDQYEYSRTR